MPDDRLITVAIHTYDHAVALKNLLESEGVNAVLQNVNLSHPAVSSGVRVRIHESDLPLALRIIENTDIFDSLKSTEVDGALNPMILVPIDFSDYSVKACDIALHLASRHKTHITLLNTYLDPYLSGNIQLSDSLSYDIAESEMRRTLDAEARRLIDEFIRKLRNRMKLNEIPPVKITSEITEGVPEEAITEYAKENKPQLIVMGTRGKGKKEKELIGSVTAEVLDSCRFPVLTVPESVNLSKADDIKHVVLFSNLDQEDILALDAIYRFFSDEHFNVTIVNVPDKKHSKSGRQAADALKGYCELHYPRFTFTVADLSLSSIVEDFNAIQQRQPVDLIAVPNKKKNIFARLFNPSLAHRLLFHSDIPMMVIPV